jgi:hypothetical protein
MSATRHIAQINVARFRVPKDDPANGDFMAALDHVNAMAEASKGFVWRLIGDGNDATDLEAIPGDPDFIVNMSVWDSVEALESFAYRQADHRAVLARRQEWFDPIEPSFALWWVEPGHVPTVTEGMARLAQLGAEGPGPAVFTFRYWREQFREAAVS